MDWINVNTQLPEEGQEIYYFSPILGIWRGKYTYKPFTHSVWYDENNQPHEEPASEFLRNAVSPHVFYSGAGDCDTDEVTHWQPYDEKRAAQGWVPLPPNHGISPGRIDEYRAWREQRAAPETPSSKPEWLEAEELLVDPSGGWCYGFPRVWNRKLHPDMTQWLIDNGYPREMAEKHLPVRLMSVPEEAAT